MTTSDKTTDADDFGRPVLLVVDAHDQDRATIESALIRRFALDFRVVAVDSADAALDVLNQLADTNSNAKIGPAARLGRVTYKSQGCPEGERSGSTAERPQAY